MGNVHNNSTTLIFTLLNEFINAAREIANPEIDWDAISNSIRNQEEICPIIPSLQKVASCNEEEEIAMEALDAVIEANIDQAVEADPKSKQLKDEAFLKVEESLMKQYDIAAAGLIRKFGIDVVLSMVPPMMREPDAVKQLADKGLNNLRFISEYAPIP